MNECICIAANAWLPHKLSSDFQRRLQCAATHAGRHRKHSQPAEFGAWPSGTCSTQPAQLTAAEHAECRARRLVPVWLLSIGCSFWSLCVSRAQSWHPPYAAAAHKPAAAALIDLHVLPQHTCKAQRTAAPALKPPKACRCAKLCLHKAHAACLQHASPTQISSC
jgi:hypothetical protein